MPSVNYLALFIVITKAIPTFTHFLSIYTDKQFQHEYSCVFCTQFQMFHPFLLCIDVQVLFHERFKLPYESLPLVHWLVWIKSWVNKPFNILINLSGFFKSFNNIAPQPKVLFHYSLCHTIQNSVLLKK